MRQLELDITWDPDEPGEDRAALGWGRGVLKVRGEPFWSHEEEDGGPRVHWTWIELLEFLGTHWTALTVEQTYPFQLTPQTPLDLREAARQRWNRLQLSPERRLMEDEELFRFESRHDLSRALQGIYFPELLMVREGNVFWLCADKSTYRVGANGLISDLEAMGDAIVQRVSQSSTPRATTAVSQWQNRKTQRDRQWVSVATGLPQSVQEQIGGEKPEFWENDDLSRDDTELAAAARLSGPRVNPQDLQQLLERVRSLEALDTTRLEEMSTKALAVLREHEDSDPFEQGYALAQWLRRERAIADRAFPDRILEDLGIESHELTLSKSIDAIGCWGPRHGPAIFLNPQGIHSSTVHGRRATEAHELCHLLVDRSSALPLAEVLGGQSPYFAERRANAFAAEFLLPREKAAEVMRHSDELEEALAQLSETYAVGQTLAAGQLLNHPDETLLTDEQRRRVEEIVTTGPKRPTGR